MKESCCVEAQLSFQLVLKVIRHIMGINYNTTLLSFSRRNTCKAFQDPWRKGKVAIDSIYRMDVDNSVRALGIGRGNVDAILVTPLITRMEPSYPLHILLQSRS